MAGENFAFESDEVSIAFILDHGLGDCIVYKKVFEALVEIEPRCRIDLFCATEHHKEFAKALYGAEKNLNRILSYDQIYSQYVGKYDLALQPYTHYILIQSVNVDRLQAMSYPLFEAVVKIHQYNQKYNYGIDSHSSVCCRDSIKSRILQKDWYEFLSCEGALPIRNNKVNIPLSPEYQAEFDKLGLKNYITIYSDIHENEIDHPKGKTWPIYYLREYVARMKKRFPQLSIVQCGGGDIKIENVDRNFLGCDLELTKHILANSLLLVGVEGGLIHLATQLGTKCIVLFGPSHQHYYGYKTNINIVSEVCYSCMDTLPDWSVCLRGFKETPCMLSITPQLVCETTCNYLNNIGFKNNA